MTEPFAYPDQPMDRGKVLWEEDLEKLGGVWGRYKDVDGDGIPYRTVSGNRHPAAAYFARGTGHDENARYTEDNLVWHYLLERLKRKYQNACQYVPGPEIESTPGNPVGVIFFGSTEPAIREARIQLAEAGFTIDSMRLRAIPFTEEVEAFIRQHERCYVFELNRDGQLHQLLTLEYPDQALKLISIAYTDGLPPTARLVREAILAKENK
jgi:2-oxoglutarate ferredoxin oxidoreductase subunit alpha